MVAPAFKSPFHASQVCTNRPSNQRKGGSIDLGDWYQAVGDPLPMNYGFGFVHNWDV